MNPTATAAPERGHASITADDVTISTDTYTDDDGQPYTVVAVWPHTDSVVVFIDDMDAWRAGEFV